jgi:hypothetical protein
MNKSLVLSFCLLTVLSGCASYEHVRPGANGIHRVLIRGVDKTEVEQNAINEAEAYCSEKDLSPAFVDENTQYTGSIKESTHKTIRKASQAASVGGGMVGVLGGNKERNIGKGVFGAGVVGSVFQDDEAYTADMKFKCVQ